MIKAFISYHHEKDQRYRNHLIYLADVYGAFEDGSVSTHDIDDNLSDESIRIIIRDKYLKDTQVTILLCGEETRHRKHVDWELKSSMIDGSKNKRSGILVINLPGASSNSWHAALPYEKKVVYPDYKGKWVHYSTEAAYRRIYPKMPERIIDNLLKPGVVMSVVPWSRIENQPENLKFLIKATAEVGKDNDYDLSRLMRQKNHNPHPVFNIHKF